MSCKNQKLNKKSEDICAQLRHLEVFCDFCLQEKCQIFVDATQGETGVA